MQMSRSLQQLLIKALSQSMGVPTMVKIARKLFRNYNIYERAGWPENIPLQSFHAAEQILSDVMKDEGLLVQFVTILIDVYQNGLMGTKINIKYLPQILTELEAIGLKYDPELETFVESKRDNMSKGWRILEEGKMYEFCLLRIDIVENSRLVREHSREIISETYTDLRNIVKLFIEKRNGRIWGWEGDGGIAAFYFKDKNVNAALSAMEILLDIFFYNMFKSKLNESLKVRIAIHTGQCQFSRDIKGMQNDTLRVLEALEINHTLPNTITLSPSVYHDLGRKLETFFLPIEIKRGHYIYRYQLIWEDVPGEK
ncbi:MAG: adenylate/guanylate cyclase domain-containing protein [Spirochaetales bacterium]|nr:adenylate/guanylate cyclase domain-containing protein [Spirochaetales bacterium]